MAGKKQKRQLRWSRERIRAELSRLDDITGLKGANVTVRLYEEREPLGLFTFIDPVRMTFGFSSPRFEDPKFTQAEALDVIRHEYAHYMEYALFGESTDHGPNWQNCCRRIGARPQTFYTSEWAELARGLEKRRAERTQLDGFTPGKQITHPSFGVGIVETVERYPTMSMVTVRFESGSRKLDVNWARQNCKFKQ